MPHSWVMLPNVKSWPPANVRDIVTQRLFSGIVSLGLIWTLVATGTEKPQRPHHPPYDSASLFSQYKAAVVQILVSDPRQPGNGTGFIVSEDGLVLTANHVVNLSARLSTPVPGPFASSIQVRLSDGVLVDAVPINTTSTDDSVKNDYAILRISRRTPTYLKLGTSSELMEGETLTIIGHPLGLQETTLLAGLISTKRVERGVAFIVFQAPNNKGLSGAPVISNRTGKVIGIVQNRLIGIGAELSRMRDDLTPPPGTTAGGVIVNGVSNVDSTIALINVLDAYLMSGMGAAIGIDSAKAQIALVAPRSAVQGKK